MGPAVKGLAELLAKGQVWRGLDLAAAARPGLPSGFAELDACLPGGGWPRGALTELLLEGCGFGEFSLLMPLLRDLCAKDLPVALVAPPWLPYGPALAQAGLRLERLVILERPERPLALGEQLLRSGGFSLLMVWLTAPPPAAALRRLQVALESEDALVILMRPASHAHLSSPAPLRLQLSPLAAPAGGLCLRVLKRRGAPLNDPLHLVLPRPGRACHAVSRPVFSPAAPGVPVLSPVA